VVDVDGLLDFVPGGLVAALVGVVVPPDVDFDGLADVDADDVVVTEGWAADDVPAALAAGDDPADETPAEPEAATEAAEAEELTAGSDVFVDDVQPASATASTETTKILRLMSYVFLEDRLA
jgi:hypothetical protein